MLSYLQLCCASVADQQHINYEHVVMDGGSTDQTAEWLRRHPSLISRSQRDNGMYEAVNKGFSIARGQIVSHLNCDEQYLPGTLRFVVEYFQNNPQVDAVFGDVLVVGPDGGLIAYRKGYRPRQGIVWNSPLHVSTAAMFLRRSVVGEGRLFYDESYKDVGDAEFILRLIRTGFRIRHVRRYMSTFAITGYNRSTRVATIPEEVARMRQTAPWYVSRFRPAWRCAGYALKLVNGAYFQKEPIRYSIYTNGGAVARTDFVVHRVSFRVP
jgi:glycosyltransferase involved in cell wall biosynthesis